MFLNYNPGYRFSKIVQVADPNIESKIFDYVILCLFCIRFLDFNSEKNGADTKRSRIFHGTAVT